MIARAPRRGLKSISNLLTQVKKFKGKEAAKYIAKAGLPANTLDTHAWTTDEKKRDQVASAVLAWAKDNGASMATHVFQPLGSTGVRLGQMGQVHNAMFNFAKDGTLGWVFDGEKLLFGETDGSSYLNGGMRATHTVRVGTSFGPAHMRPVRRPG